MKPKKQKRLLELALGCFIFLLLASFTFFFTPLHTSDELTGLIGFETEEDTQIFIQKIFRNDLLGAMKEDARFCIVTGVNESRSYKIRNQAGFFSILPSSDTCEGEQKEDFIFHFKPSKTIQKLQSSDDLSSRDLDHLKEEITLSNSKYVKNQKLYCTEEFQETYCPLMGKMTPKEREKLVGDCCTAYLAAHNLGSSQKTFIDHLFDHTWVIVAFIICVFLAVSAYILFSSENGRDEKAELMDYIEETLDQGYTEHSIRIYLEQNGWDPSLVTQAFQKRKKKNPIEYFGDRFEQLF